LTMTSLFTNLKMENNLKIYYKKFYERGN